MFSVDVGEAAGVQRTGVVVQAVVTGGRNGASWDWFDPTETEEAAGKSNREREDMGVCSSGGAGGEMWSSVGHQPLIGGWADKAAGERGKKQGRLAGAFGQEESKRVRDG